MSNKLVDAYRADLASRGQVDPRDDDTITAELGEIAQRNSPHLFDQFPDFGQQYSAIRDANAPGLGEEFGRAFKAGSQGLASTALGGLGLITGSDYLKGKAKSFDDDAAENAPTIPTLEDIAPGESNSLRKALSRDALRYGISKFGSVAPSIAESAVTAAAGAAAGSAFGPEGTLAGAFGGVIEKSLVKSAIKKMVQKGLAKSLAEKGLISEASEVGIEQALKAGSKSIAADVAAEAAAIGGFKGGVAANALGSFVLNTGDVASEGADTGTTLALGAVSAIPDTILPAYVLKKFFPGLGKEAAKEAGKTFLAKNAKKLAELVGVPAEEFGQEYFQEGVNVVARNMKEGKDPLTFTDADLKRLREAGIAGAAGGVLAAPGVMFSGRESPVAEQSEPANPSAAKPPVIPAASPALPVADGETANVPPKSIARQVALMTDDTEKQALFDQLTAKQAAGAVTPDEVNAIELLKSEGFEAPAITAPVNTSSEVLPVAENPITTLPTATDPAAESVSSGILPETSQPVAVETLPPTEPTTVPPEITPVSPVVAESPAENPQLLAPAPVGDLVTPAVPTAPVVSPVEVAAEKAAETPVEQIAPVAPAPSLSLEQRLTNEIKRPDPVEFGPIASVDTTAPANVEDLDLKGAMDATGSRSSTRVAVILRAKDGSVVMAGLLPRRQISAVDGTTKFGVGVQFFGTKQGSVHSIKEGGKVPALLSDVVAAGYTYVGKVNFDAAPGKIFQRWSTPESFQAALTKALPTQTSAAAETSNRAAVKLDAQANALVAERDSAAPNRQLEIDEELAELRNKARLIGADPKFMTAYHGTPHSVDEFSTEFIGTGEGAQSYGWGLYFAEKKEVGEGYKKKLSGDKTGNLYTVDIADSAINRMLDWDKPLSKQDASIREAVVDGIKSLDQTFLDELDEVVNGEYASMTGKEVYGALVRAAREVPLPGGEQSTGENAKRDASEFLSRIGVEGIKYLDKASRTAGDGTRNFVVFDSKHAKILEENGMVRQRPKFSNDVAPQVEQPTPLATEADYTNQLAIAAARLRQFGGRVDILARSFLQQSLARDIQQRIDDLNQRAARSSPDSQAVFQARIAKFKQQLDAVSRVRGVAYTPWHMAIGLNDILNANVGDLATLIHEGAHTILGRDPLMQGRVLRAVQVSTKELRTKLEASQSRSGMREANLNDPEELIVSTLGQQLALEGIPDSSSLARAVWGWVKDLYYRMAMAVQEAFGAQPDSKLALAWFENQLRRVVGGDYDYRFASLVDRFKVEARQITLRRLDPFSGTPGGMADYFDPISNGIRQPTALPTSTEAVEWNQKYATETDAQTEDGLEIPGTEARARIDGAALNELADLATKLYGESGLATADSGQLSLEQWWAMVHGGEMPQTTLANITVADAATARIGGERMTDAMNGLARVQAKALVLKFQQKAASKLAQSVEKTATAEKKLISEAKRVNKVEGELRDAEMHEATLRDALKENIHALIKSYRAGLVNAKQMGELAQAVADAEQLTEGDVLPAQYQAVFKAVLADEIPIFQYVDAISKLDLNLKDLSRAEIDEAIADNAPGDEALTRLMEPKNKPLRVALTALAKMHADQIDMLQLRRANREQFLAIHGDLRAIREATEERLNQLQATYRNDKKAATFADRLKRSYVEKRAKLRKQQRTIQEEERRQGLVLQAQAAIKAKIDEMETSGLAHPSEWRAAEGATYLAMVQGDDGKWRSREKTLRFNRDGTSVNAAELLGDLASNRQYLLENKAKAGARTFQLVERQVNELSNLDVQRAYPEATKLFFEKWIMPSSDLILSGGGAGAARAAQMLKRWQFITFSNWRNTLENPAEHWVVDLKNITKAAGLKETSEFLSQVYDPVVYFIGTEPGLEEGPALREAVRAARRRLTTQPTEQFDEMLKEFLRKTRAMSQTFVKIAEDAGVFIEDDRLGGELRKAVSRGWLTVIRRMNSATVSTIVRDMERAGWALEFADGNGEGSVPTSFDKGVSEKRRVIKATTFDALMPALAPDEQQAAQRTQILETPQLFSQAISGFFSPGIIQRWLAPFINKPGDPVFAYQGKDIDQLEVQQAWQNAGGNVAAWIDALGQRIGVGEDTTTIEDADEIESALSPQASWRASMLRQMDDLYLMESRLAADANQVRNLFDASGKPAHLLMDARENDKLPPEHIEHMTFDPINTRNLLATIAFHAAFGRNGVAMEQAFNEITSDLGARKAAFDSLKGSDAKKKADAKALGMDYADLHKAARVYRQVTEGMDFLKAQFGFGNQAGVLTDMRGGLTVLHFIAQQTTNNPKTGLLNMLQLVQRPIARRTLDLVALRDTAASAGEIGKQFFGQLFESFGLHLMRASQHARDIGDVQGQIAGDVSWAVKLGSVVGKRGEELPTAIKTLRSISALQSKGARIGWGEAKEFPRMANIPFLSNTMQAMSLAAAISNGTAEARSVESLVHAAVQYFASNPEALNDPTFKLTAKDLRMTDAAWFHSPGSFEYMRRALVDYGIGNLEQVAREASERMTRGEPVLTKDQVLKAAMMSNNELDLQGSINTSPGIWASNPILKFATPLLGWPIRQMAQMNAAMRQADGRASVLQAMKTIGILAAWSLPMGLAFTLMTDWYDDKILKKKSQLGTISPLAALPVVGPALALATSDLSAKDQGLAMFQRLSRAGNIYGLGADFVSSTLAGLDPTSGQRPFSLDSRVLAFSQLLSIQQAISNWINSGFTTTYASVERPLIASIGGNGALSAVDIFAGALGIDIQETRIVQRTNVNQWLRAAGRETGLELKKGGGAAVAPSATGVWTREMWLGALTNDRLAFLDSYRRAIAAAREDGEADPEKAVLESWRARNPLNVFGSRPTQQQLQKALAVMSDSGRGAVSEALRLYEAYTGMIAPSPIERAQATAMRAAMRVPNSDSIRREMASMALR